MMVNAVRIDARLSNVVLEQDAVSTEELARIDVVSTKKTTFNQVLKKNSSKVFLKQELKKKKNKKQNRMEQKKYEK